MATSEANMQDELDAMNKMVQLLEPLDVAARARVLAWVIGVLDVQVAPSSTALALVDKGTFKTSVDGPPIFATFAELFHAAEPRLEKEKALLAAYWIQKSSGVDQFASQQVNTELKHIGYGVTNITDALSQLISDRPSLAIQLTKSGQSQQARKTYKITDAGYRYVHAMLNQKKD
jgi:hypothetical protein